MNIDAISAASDRAQGRAKEQSGSRPRAVLITVRGQARKFGSRLLAACDLIRARASPRMRIDECARSTALAEILDPGRREGRTGEGNLPARHRGAMPPGEGGRRAARPFRRRALTRDVAVPESLCAHIKSTRKRLTSLRGVV